MPQFIHVYKWVPARRLFSLSSIHECSTIFSSTVKTAEPPPPLLFHFLFIFVQLTSVSFISAKIFQNWSTSAGYEESVGGFEPIRKGEILNECYKLIIIRTKFSKSIFVGFHHWHKELYYISKFESPMKTIFCSKVFYTYTIGYLWKCLKGKSAPITPRTLSLDSPWYKERAAVITSPAPPISRYGVVRVRWPELLTAA